MSTERAGKIHITRRLSGIHAAWHFGFAVSFGGESGVRKVGLCGIHPLTRRYKYAAEVNLAMSYSRMRKPHTTIGAITFHF